MMAVTWNILTGEFPPQLGGVSDYTKQIAANLLAAGDQVHVFAPPTSATETAGNDDPLHVERLVDCFGRRGRKQIESALQRCDHPRRVLVQYVPHAYGHRGMNLGFARWISRLAKRESVDVMFHEVHFPVQSGQPLRHRLLGLATRWMARQVAVNAARRFISTSTWDRTLSSLGVSGPNQWIPVPTNLPIRTHPRNLSDEPSSLCIGHFGTYGSHVVDILGPLLIALKQNTDCTFMLLGRGSTEYANQFLSLQPQFKSILHAPPIADDQALAAAISSCDLVVQPYPDGMSTRRTSAMASLALGVPIVTHSGVSTESIWAESGALALAKSSAVSDYLAVVIPLLHDHAARQALGARGAKLYAEHFALEHTISALRTIAVAPQ